MSSKSNIPLKGPSVNIVHQCGPCLSDILESKFGCKATIEGVEFEDPIAAHQTRLMVAHEKRFEGTLPTGVRVSVWKADLTDFSADAVVNAANEALQHIGGLALALSTAGGPRIQTESDDYINVFGNVTTGDAIVTTAGKLKCKMIIHAVGPRLTFNPRRYDVDRAEPLLERTIFSILHRVEENQLETVAIPAISSGIFNYPLPQCADTIVKAVKNYYEQFPRYHPKEIMLVNNDEPTVKEMVRACHKTRAPPPPPHISVMGPSDAAVCEATRWLAGLLLKGTGPVLIQNNFILHLSKEERCQLTRLQGVSIKEEFEKSRASITVDGREHEAVAVAALQVEAMLCTIQNEFITEQKSDMFRFTTQNVSVQREKMDRLGPLFVGKKALFDRTGMRIAKVDEVKNATLQMLFDRKKKQLKGSRTQKMYQRIPAQFIELISHVGFHTECAPPDDPAYGQGIYFTDTVRRAMEVWKVSNEEYVHFVEAEVLVGESTRGKPEFILPPALTSDPYQMYDSVSGPGIAVIFSSYQALPKCIITCKRI